MQKSPNSVPGIRWLAAGLLILYGFAKLNGSQFTVLDSDGPSILRPYRKNFGRRDRTFKI